MDDDWDAQRMLDLYIYDRLKRRNMHTTAEIFAKEANVMPKQAFLNPPGGFLPEWWSIFWDMYSSRTNNHPMETGESLSKEASVADNGPQSVPHVLPSLVVNYLLQETCQAMPRQGFPNFQENFTPPISPRPQYVENVLHDASSSMFPELDNIYISSMFPGLDHHVHMMEMQEQAIRRLIAEQNFELEHTERPVEDMNSNFHFLSVQKLAHLLTSSSGSSHCQEKNFPQNHQLAIDREDRTRTDIRKSTVTNKQSKDQTANTMQGCTNGYGYGYGYGHDKPTTSVVQNVGVEIPLDEDIQSFLSDEAMDNAGFSLGSPERSSSDQNKLGKEEFQFSLLTSLALSDKKLSCCDFSSTGKFLAAAGHEKKIIILNMQSTTGQALVGHSQLITGIRFKPHSHHFATSSFDKIVKIWNAVDLREPLHNLVGHSDHVMSLDFHPKRPNLLCSCANDGEIRLWDMNDSLCVSSFKGADWLVRFQPQTGNLVAAVSRNVINLIDVETGKIQHRLEGHANDIRSICWDVSGKYMVSASDEKSRVWSFTEGGKCVHELHSNGNKFASCAFHPVYPHLVVLGSYQSISVWNPTTGHETLKEGAHEGIVSGLASSPEMNMFASVSHDRLIKIWK